MRPDAAFGADLIAGFPTESEAMFENSLTLVDDAGLSQLHVFPFSPRTGTPAARMPQLGAAVAKERGARLRARGEQARMARFQALAGMTRTVLVEKPGFGHSACFAPVSFEGAAPSGTIVSVLRDRDRWRKAHGTAGGMRTFGEAPPTPTGLFARLKQGLAKSSAGLTGSLTGLFTKKKLDAETVAELEEALIRADMGVSEAKRLSAAVAKNRYDSEITDAEVRAILAREIALSAQAAAASRC